MTEPHEPGTEETDVEDQARSPAVEEEHVEPDASFEPTAPIFPVEVALKSFSWWIQRYPHGAIELKFAGTVTQPTQFGPQEAAIPPGYSIIFPNEEVWERFQEHVAASEVPSGPAIQTAPAGALDALRERRAADHDALRRR